MNETTFDQSPFADVETYQVEPDVSYFPPDDEVEVSQEPVIDDLAGAKNALSHYTLQTENNEVRNGPDESAGVAEDAAQEVLLAHGLATGVSLFPPDTTPEEDEARLQELLDELGLNDACPGRSASPVSSSTITQGEDHVSHDKGVGKKDVASTGSSEAACAPRGLPIIEVKAGELEKTLASAEHVLADSGDYYSRGDRIVSVRFDSALSRHHIRELTAQDLVVTFAGLSKWSRFDKRKGEWMAIDPCPRICRLLAESWKFGRLPVLNGIVSQPFLRADSTVRSAPGYDPHTRILGMFDAGGFSIPEHPNRDDAMSALSTLDELLSECAFETLVDRSAALSALLTAAVRPSLPHAPMFHVMAHQPGSGKSFLCQLISAFATATPGSPVAFPRSNDACDKLLLSQLMKAPAVVEFDNLTTDLRPFDKLCSALTSEYLEGRQLGQSRTVVVPTKTLFLSSGNNVRPIDDMVRRCICIHLDPGMESPAARVYKRPNLLDEVRRDRIKFIGAALTIVRAWVLAGRPIATCPSLASYSDWSNWCRQPLLWLGQPDPAESVFQGLKEDPSQLLLGRVLAGWHEKHGGAPKMVRDVVNAAVHLDETDDFRDALAEAAGGNESINVRKLGHWLARNEGRIVSPYRLRKAPKTRNAENWQVVESDVSVSSVLLSSKTT